MASPSFTPNSEQCVEFYYNHRGNLIGRLNLYVRHDGDEIGLPLWSSPAAVVTDVWQIAQVPIRNGVISNDYKVIFEEYVEGGQPG